MRFGEVERFILFGGGLPLLHAASVLQEAGRRKLLVVSSRRHAEARLGERTLLAHCSARGLPIEVVGQLREVELHLSEGRAMGLSFSAEWIFTKELIDRFEGRLVNLHESPLPLGRGGGGHSWKILAGDRLGGATIHLVDAGVDTGAILLQETIQFPEWCMVPADYHAIGDRVSLDLVERFLSMVLANEAFAPSEQDEDLSTYWPRLETSRHGFLDWSWDSDEIVRFCRAFDRPYGGASTLRAGERVYLRDVSALAASNRHPFQRGLVFRIASEGICVATGDGGVCIGTVLDDAGNRLNGGIRLGERFVTPTRCLEEALEHRAVYRPRGPHNRNERNDE